MVALKAFFGRFSFDALGFSASAICAIHCLAVPAIALFSSWTPSGIAHSHNLESVILVASTFIGSVSIVPAWLRHHRKALPLVVFVIGLALITIGRFHITMLTEAIVTTSGALMVAFSHYLNWRYCRTHHEAVNRK